MVGHISTVRRKLGTRGFLETSAIVARRAYDSLFHGRLLLFKADIAEDAVDVEPADDENRILARTSVDELTADERSTFEGYGGESLIKLWQERFQKGHRLFLIYHGGDVVGASWLFEGEGNDFFTVPVAPGEVFVVNVFILESFRGKGLGTRSLALILRKMKEEGFRRVYICTKEWNHFRRAIGKNGFELVGKVREIKMFGKVFQVWSECGGRDFP